MVSNLLTNAARYTAAGGDITVIATRAADVVELIVRDTGIGIERDMLGRVFELFVQAKPTAERKEGGLGLGLALVHNLVALHGGTVEARSEGPGHGTEIVVRLPAISIEKAVEAAVVPKPRRASEGPKRRILLVDDNVDAAEMLADVLRMKGHEVFVAHDGPSAIVLLATIQVDTAILDIGLPVMDGYELAGHIRLDPAMKTARLIALTGYGQDTDRDRARSAGFDVHLVKPVSIAELTRSLADVPSVVA